MRTLAILCCLLAAGATLAQSSAGYRLTERGLKPGGHPAQGTVLASTAYRMEVDAIGDALRAPRLAGTLFLMDVGLAQAYRPPASAPKPRRRN